MCEVGLCVCVLGFSSCLFCPSPCVSFCFILSSYILLYYCFVEAIFPTRDKWGGSDEAGWEELGEVEGEETNQDILCEKKDYFH